MENRSRGAERKSNLELFRIISMFFIVAHHYVVHAGLLSAGPIAQDPYSLQSQFLLVFGAFGKIGINCFVLISGYFMCKKEITLRKFLKLICEFLFYKIIVTLAFHFTGYYRMSLWDMLLSFLPIRNLGDDFYTGYFVFFLFIPFLNILVRNMNEKAHVRLMLLSFCVYTLLYFLPDCSVTLNNSVWYTVLYFIASYIRLYPKKLFDSKRFWRNAAILCLLACAGSVIVCSRLTGRFNSGITIAWHFVMDSNNLLALLMGLTAFMYFKNLEIGQSRVINTVASTTFGVLLCHANGIPMKTWLWTDVLHTYDYQVQSPLAGILHAVIATVLVFAAGSCIDLIRMRFAEKPFFRLLDRVLPRFTAWWSRTEDKLFKKCHISD